MARKTLGGAFARNQRLLGLIIFSMRCRRPVAHLARNRPVEGLALHSPLTVVALDAYLTTRIPKRQSGCYANRIRSVVTRFTERRRYEAAPHDYQHRHRRQEHNG
jgi:hypothetical protein